jgi:hypothetical protein
MIVKLARFLPKFRGQKSHVQCFLHILNLVAKVIIQQFEGSTKADDALAELEVNIDGIEGDESEDDGDPDEEAPELSEIQGDDSDEGDVTESIQPVKAVLNKVSRPYLCQ